MINTSIKSGPKYDVYLAWVREQCGEDDYEVALPDCDPLMEITDYKSFLFDKFNIKWSPVEALARAHAEQIEGELSALLELEGEPRAPVKAGTIRPSDSSDPIKFGSGIPNETEEHK